MQCFLKSKCIKAEISMVKIGELLRKIRSLRSCFHILPPGALTPQGIEGAMKRDVSKHWCTLQWCASKGWYIAHENWTSWQWRPKSDLRIYGTGAWKVKIDADDTWRHRMRVSFMAVRAIPAHALSVVISHVIRKANEPDYITNDNCYRPDTIINEWHKLPVVV